MERNYLPVTLLVVSSLFLASCIVSQTVNVKSLDVAGPHNHPPVHLEIDSASTRVTVAARFDINTGPQLRGTLTDTGTVQYPGDVRWRMPDVTGAIDVDLPVSPAVAISLGADYADELWGAHAGLGLRFRGKYLAGRLEAGVQWQSLSTHAVYLLSNQYAFSGSTDTILVNRRQEQNHSNWYGAFTLNTRFPEAFVNGFVQIGLVSQTLFSVNLADLELDDAEFNSSSVILTPGLCFDVGSPVRLLVGTRINFENRLIGPSPDPKFMPFIQFDWGL